MCLESVSFINTQISSCAWQSIKGMRGFPFALAIMIYREDPFPEEIKVVFATRHLAHIDGGNERTWKINSFLLCCPNSLICFFLLLLLLFQD